MFNPAIETYGTAGLPKFGGGQTYSTGTGTTGATAGSAAIGEVDVAFNNLISVLKKNCVPGNNMLLWFFGVAFAGLYSTAIAVVSAKPVVNA